MVRETWLEYSLLYEIYDNTVELEKVKECKDALLEYERNHRPGYILELIKLAEKNNKNIELAFYLLKLWGQMKERAHHKPKTLDNNAWLFVMSATFHYKNLTLYLSFIDRKYSICNDITDTISAFLLYIGRNKNELERHSMIEFFINNIPLKRVDEEDFSIPLFDCIIEEEEEQGAEEDKINDIKYAKDVWDKRVEKETLLFAFDSWKQNVMMVKTLQM